jgi:branched-chain amino acid transport system permease protein
MQAEIDRRPARSWPGRFLGWAVLFLVLALPFALGNYGVALATEILIFAIFAMSLDIVLGYTGLPSFGHAAFFGIGAYTTVILAATYGVSVWIGIPLGILLSIVLATIIGYFSVRSAGIAFLMVTMAASQLLYSVALRWRDVTGGTDGIGGIPTPSLAGLSLGSPTTMYGLIAAMFLVSLWLLRRLIASQLGHTFVGIRENEQRMQAIGYPVARYKLLSFVIGGAFAGLAGGLYGTFNGFISTDALHWSMSGDVLVMVVVGGAGTLLGPAIGAAVLLLAKYLISSYVGPWLLVVGLIFIACVLTFREGIYGYFLKIYRRRMNAEGVAS